MRRIIIIDKTIRLKKYEYLEFFSLPLQIKLAVTKTKKGFTGSCFDSSWQKPLFFTLKEINVMRLEHEVLKGLYAFPNRHVNNDIWVIFYLYISGIA